MKFLTGKNVKAVVTACNSATSAAINYLREKYNIIVIGMEPAVKPAAESVANKKIVLMATEITLKEKKLDNLLTDLNLRDNIIKLATPELIGLVEKGEISGKNVTIQLEKYFNNIDMKNVGAVVLGCTHFVFFKRKIDKIFNNKITVFDGNYGTSKHLKNSLIKTNLVNPNKKQTGNVEFFNSGNNSFVKLSEELLNTLLSHEKRKIIKG